LLKGEPLTAHGAAVSRKIGIPFNTGDTPVFYMDQHPASAVTATTVALD
jgi:hypothetical protein